MRTLLILSLFLSLFTLPAYGKKTEIDTSVSAGFTNDIFRDGGEAISAEFIQPSLSVEQDFHAKGSPYVLKGFVSTNARISPKISESNTLSASTALDGAYLLGQNQELGHNLHYAYGIEAIDRLSYHVDTHSLGLSNRWKALTENGSHSIGLPIFYKYFDKKVTGDGQSPFASNARENDYRNSHFLAGLNYEYKHFVYRRDYLSFSPALEWRQYFERPARATDGGILPAEEQKNLQETRFSGVMAYKTDLKLVVLEPRFSGTYNRDLNFKSENYWQLNPSIDLTWRAHRSFKITNSFSYESRRYLNKRSDDFNVTGPKLSVETIHLGSGFQFKPTKQIGIIGNLDWQKYLSTNKLSEYSALTALIGLQSEI